MVPSSFFITKGRFTLFTIILCFTLSFSFSKAVQSTTKRKVAQQDEYFFSCRITVIRPGEANKTGKLFGWNVLPTPLKGEKYATALINSHKEGFQLRISEAEFFEVLGRSDREEKFAKIAEVKLVKSDGGEKKYNPVSIKFGFKPAEANSASQYIVQCL